LKVGDEAAIGPLTLIENVPPAGTKESKSRAYIFGYPLLHDPRLAPIAVGPNTTLPLEFLMVNVAPVSALDAMR
jgi:hypothetical protein